MLNVRCTRCNKLLFRQTVQSSFIIEIKCSRCQFINKLECHERQFGEDKYVKTIGAVDRR